MQFVSEIVCYFKERNTQFASFDFLFACEFKKYLNINPFDTHYDLLIIFFLSLKTEKIFFLWFLKVVVH